MKIIYYEEDDTLFIEFQKLFEQAHFITHIENEKDYSEALALMDELVEDYEHNKPLIDILSNSIEKWEDQSEQFLEFNRDIESKDNAISLLRILMSQYHLKGEDLKNEIGSKSLGAVDLLCTKFNHST